MLPATALLLALAGLAVAGYLWRLHFRVHAGDASSFCDVNETVSCSDVARSPWSVFLGVPVAAWGALAYLAVAGLAVSALARRRPGPTWPGGVLLLLTGLLSAGAVALAAVSRLVLHKLCVMCSVSWAVSFALLGVSLALVRRAGGPAAAVRGDLQALRARPLPAAVGAGALAALAVALLAGYALAPKPPPPPVLGVIPVGPPGSLVVYEYSDYLCPFCARIHVEEKAIRAARPDVRFVRRFFPLDATCNRRLTATVHEGACDLARGGICAEKQGRFEAYDDAAFANQEARPGPEELARMAGLDPAAFDACLSSSDTQQRLAEDIQSGNELGVRGTPSFLLQGKVVGAPQLLQLLGVATEVARP